MRCGVCERECKSLRSLSIHLRTKHDLSLLKYMLVYEAFTIPRCRYCDADAALYRGLKFRVTCGSGRCIRADRKTRTLSDSAIEKVRQARLRFMKDHPEKTGWRLANEMSYPEKAFLRAVEERGLLETFDVVREYCVFPYYIDFALLNVSVAVEIDGSQHELNDRKMQDDKKDRALKEQGWRVFRVRAGSVLHDVDSVVSDLLLFVGDVEKPERTCSVMTHRERKILMKSQKQPRPRAIDALTEEQKERLLHVDESGWGSLMSVSREMGISHSWARKLIRKLNAERDKKSTL